MVAVFCATKKQLLLLIMISAITPQPLLHWIRKRRYTITKVGASYIEIFKWFIYLYTDKSKFNYELHRTSCGTFHIPYYRIIPSTCNQGGILHWHQKLDNLCNRRSTLWHSIDNGQSSNLVDDSWRRCILFFLEHPWSDPSARACSQRLVPGRARTQEIKSNAQWNFTDLYFVQSYRSLL